MKWHFASNQIVAVAENNSSSQNIFIAFFCSLLLAGIFLELFGQKILTQLRKKDTLNGKVELRKFGKIMLLCNLLFFFTLFVCSICLQDFILATLFLIISVVLGVRMMHIMSTRVKITDSTLTYITFFHNCEIDFKEINQVCWVSRGRSFGYTLVVKTVTGQRIEFPQIYFIGLNDLWERFGQDAL